MTRLLLKNCCVCVSVRTGSFIVGYYQLFWNAQYLLINAVMLWAVLDVDIQTFGHEAARPATSSELIIEIQSSAMEVAVTVVTAISTLLLVIKFVFIVMLIVGLHQSRPGLINAYIIFTYICLAIDFILLILSLFLNISLAKIFADIVCYALYVYFVLVIRSYYYQLKQSEEKRPAPANELTAVE